MNLPTQMKKKSIVLITFLIIAFSFVLSSAHAINQTDGVASQTSTPPSTEINVSQMLATLSDEQVRQMLIEELKKDIPTEQSSDREFSGPGSVFSALLNAMSSGHDENKSQFDQLLSGIPKIIPDLKEVYRQLCH